MGHAGSKGGVKNMSTEDRFGGRTQRHANNPLWDGPGFSRRQFFNRASVALMATGSLSVL